MVRKSPSEKAYCSEDLSSHLRPFQGLYASHVCCSNKDVLYNGGQHMLFKGALLWGHMAIFIAWTHIVPLNNLDYGGIKVF